MADIRNYIALQDGFTPTIEKVDRSMERVSDRFSKTGRIAQDMADKVQGATRKMGVISQIAIGSFIAGGLTEFAKGITNSVMGMIDVADAYASIHARLKNISGSQENAIYLNGQIYASAQRARGAYLDMATSVATLATSAKDAFPDPREAVAFVEGINKLFTVGGVSGENKKFAMIQLTQGMASGALMGDEFRSISENAPVIQDMIAKTMGVARGELKKLSGQGAITADVIRRAILENMDEINARFEAMPKTWADNATEIANFSHRAFSPVYALISDIANSEEMKRGIATFKNIITATVPVLYALINGVNTLAGVVVEGLGYAFDFLSNNMWIAYGALGVLCGYLAYSSVLLAISTGNLLINAVAMATKMVADYAATAAVIALTVAQEGLNTALALCPLTLVVGAVLVLIGVFYLAVSAVNYFADTSISATGLIAGAFAWTYSLIYNLVAVGYNIFVAFANFLGAVFVDPLGATYNLFVDIWNGISEYVASAINDIIDMVNHIPGMSKVVGTIQHVTAITGDRKDIPGAFEISRRSYANSFEYAKSGYHMGESAQNSITSILDGGIMQKMLKEYDRKQFDASKLDIPQTLSDKQDPSALENAKNHSKTAKNTERLANTLEITDAELKDLKDSVTKEALREWQNQHIEVHVENHNTIDKELDIDGVVGNLTDKLISAVKNCREGVRV